MAWLVTLVTQAILHIVSILLISESCRQLGLGRASRTSAAGCLALSSHRPGRLRRLALGQTFGHNRPHQRCILSNIIERSPTLTRGGRSTHLPDVRLKSRSLLLNLDSLISKSTHDD